MSKRIFKGKVKYNFLLSITQNMFKYMLFCFAMGIFIIVGFKFCGAPINWKSIFTIDFSVVIVFSMFIAFIYLYGKYYNNLLQQWDKKCFEILEVDDKIRIMRFDNMKIISFNDIRQIKFSLCKDKLPQLPKSYDVKNAQMVVELKNGEKITYFVQTLSVLYRMLKYLRSLGLQVEAEEFDNNMLYKLQAHYMIIYFCAVFTILLIIITSQYIG